MSDEQRGDYYTSSYRRPAIHPVEGARCEKYDDDKHGDQHLVVSYWTGGDSLRWPAGSLVEEPK